MALATASSLPAVNGLPLLDYLADNRLKSQLVVASLNMAISTFELEKGHKIRAGGTKRQMHRIIALAVHEGETSGPALVDLALDPWRPKASDVPLGGIEVEKVKKRRVKPTVN